MTWYKTEEKRPKRGDRLIFKGRRNPEKELYKYDVLVNFIFDSEWFDTDKKLEDYWLNHLEKEYKYWGYMDDFIKDEDED